MQVGHDVFARGFQVREEGNAIRDGLEVFNVELDADGVGHGDEVQYGVGRASGDVDHDHGILEGLSGQDVRGTNVLDQQLLDCLARRHTLQILDLGFGGVGRGSRQGHTHHFNGGSHSVGRVHTTTSTTTRAGIPNNIKPLRLGDLAGQELTVGLESGHNIDIGIALHRRTPRLNRPTINHQTGPIHPPHRHHHTGHVLITPRNTDISIIPLTSHDRLDRIGNQIPTLQRVPHPLRPHANRIANPHRVELVPDQPGLLHTLAHPVVQVQQVHVARVAIVPNRRNSDLPLVQVLVLESCGVQHRLRGTLRDGLRDMAGDLVDSRVGVGGEFVCAGRVVDSERLDEYAN